MRNRLFGLLNITHRYVSGTTTPEVSSGKVSRRMRWLLFGFGIGIPLGGGWAYKEYSRRLSEKPIMNATSGLSAYYSLNASPNYPPSRSVIFPSDTSGLKLTLYQYQSCPFCCKVRAMLDFCQISYNIVEVNPVLKTQLKWSSNYHKVPVLIIETLEGQILQLNDSSMIISALYSYLTSRQDKSQAYSLNKQETTSEKDLLHFVNCYPMIEFLDDDGVPQTDIMNKYSLMNDLSITRTNEEVLQERYWRKWVDTVYVHTLSPNIYRTLFEAIESFKNFDKVGEWDKNFPVWERVLVIYVGAFTMWMISKNLKRRHKLKPDVRVSLYEESSHWLRKIKQKGRGDFMGGSTPNLSDLAVYGVLSSIEGCAAFKDLDENSKIIRTWYRKVEEYLRNPVNKTN